MMQTQECRKNYFLICLAYTILSFTFTTLVRPVSFSLILGLLYRISKRSYPRFSFRYSKLPILHPQYSHSNWRIPVDLSLQILHVEILLSLASLYLSSYSSYLPEEVIIYTESKTYLPFFEIQGLVSNQKWDSIYGTTHKGKQFWENVLCYLSTGTSKEIWPDLIHIL